MPDLLLGALLGLVVGVTTLLVLGLCWAASREPVRGEGGGE